MMKSAAYTSLADAIEAAAERTEKKAPPVVPEPPEVPPELEGAARRLWIIRARIDATRRALARADVEPGGLGRVSQLTGQLVGLLEQEERLAPPGPADAHAEERRWRAAADACVAKIKAGIAAAKAA